MSAPPLDTSNDHTLKALLLAAPRLPLQRLTATPDEHLWQHTAALLAEAAQRCAEPEPLVSVILPTRDRAKVLAAAVASVLAQSHQRLELIIIDDGSRDGTAALLAALRDPRIRVIDGGGKGVAYARNLGLAARRGGYVFYLDSDNVWHPNHIRNLLTAMRISGADCAYDILRMVRPNAPNRYLAESFDWNECLKGNYIDLNVFAHRADLIQAPKDAFDPALWRMEDWDFILRLTRGRAVAFAPVPGCDYSDDPRDAGRISVREPHLFQRLLREKIASGVSISELIERRSFRIALRAEEPDQQPLAQALGAALRRAGHAVNIAAAGSPFQRAADLTVLFGLTPPTGARPDDMLALVLSETVPDPEYLQFDRFDVLCCVQAAQAAHLTAILRRPVQEIPLHPEGTKDFDALAFTLIASLRRALAGKRRARSYAPAPGLLKQRRLKVGLLAQRGRNWPNASAYLRVIAPLTTPRALQHLELVELTGANDARMNDCQICLVQRLALPNVAAAEALADSLRQRGATLAVDTDDAFAPVGAGRERVTAFDALLQRADLVTFASKPLQVAQGHRAARSLVVENRLDPRVWRGGKPAAPWSDDDPLRLVYLGTPTHDADFACLSTALDCLEALHPGRFRLTVLGALAKPPAAAWLTPEGAHLTQTGYPDFCQRALRFAPFHVGVAPLAPGAFNDAKSDIKFLDYTALGAAALLANRAPYAQPLARGLAWGVGPTPNDWQTALQTLWNERDAAQERLAAARAWLWAERSTFAPGGMVDALLSAVGESCDVD